MGALPKPPQRPDQESSEHYELQQYYADPSQLKQTVYYEEPNEQYPYWEQQSQPVYLDELYAHPLQPASGKDFAITMTFLFIALGCVLGLVVFAGLIKSWAPGDAYMGTVQACQWTIAGTYYQGDSAQVITHTGTDLPVEYSQPVVGQMIWVDVPQYAWVFLVESRLYTVPTAEPGSFVTQCNVGDGYIVELQRGAVVSFTKQ
ncbi:hypothetical protein KBC79_03815 [Candidatus Woesebacteria bacterium]|nr:hypothetical protein [Candidatus Woesebacteria bacterium]